MIGKLTGKIELISEDNIIVDVNGVGYSVFVSSNTISYLSNGQTSSLHIETYVREDIISLFGFITKEEKECFLKLTTVSGVGNRVALAILSIMKPEEVAKAISLGDKHAFKQASGVGLKLAERIILELKDKILFLGEIEKFDKNIDKNILADSISALANLGINKNEAGIIVSKILKENQSITIDEIIRLALRSRN